MALSVLAVLLPALASPVTAGTPVVRTPAGASYEFLLRAGQAGADWNGHGSITFTNAGSAPLTEVYLRLWSNGVRGCGLRSIVVSDLGGGSLSDERLRCTELEVTLDAPLAVGASAAITFDLSISIPAVDDRFGVHRGLALAGTALPTLSINDDAGWHRLPFENLGESFYSLVSDYEVTFVTPAKLDVAASGIVTDRTEANGERWRTTYTASQVRDFAWAAGRLRRIVERARGTDVVVWYQRGAVTPARARDLAADAAHAVRTLGDAFGDYPYPEVDVVLAGRASFGGMEYPTIVFSEPSRITMAHELAHQWFYGIVGNDQYAEPWLDESFATWAMRLPFDPRRACRGIRWPSAGAALTNDMGYWSRHPGEYGLVYFGGACLLANLSQRFGHERFLNIVGRYAQRHAMGIARTEDFMDAIETAAARHLPGFDVAAYWRHWRVDPT